MHAGAVVRPPPGRRRPRLGRIAGRRRHADRSADDAGLVLGCALRPARRLAGPPEDCTPARPAPGRKQMIRHVVLFAWTEDMTEEVERQFAAELNALAPTLPGVRSY